MDTPLEHDGLVDEAWTTLHAALGDVEEKLALRRDCGEAEQLLDRVANAHLALHGLENALERTHLACCVFPRVRAPTEVAVALARLSERRTGALIAFEQQDSLADYVATGTIVDGQLSAGLLESLFYPGNPLHDGAVIVRGSRIVAAGVFLPVAVEHRDRVHGRLLGSRHRAAVGLSRLTDALVFVVSEETGETALALHGALHGLNVRMLLHDHSDPGTGSSESHAPMPGGSWLSRLRARIVRARRGGIRPATSRPV